MNEEKHIVKDTKKRCMERRINHMVNSDRAFADTKRGRCACNICPKRPCERYINEDCANKDCEKCTIVVMACPEGGIDFND